MSQQGVKCLLINMFLYCTQLLDDLFSCQGYLQIKQLLVTVHRKQGEQAYIIICELNIYLFIS